MLAAISKLAKSRGETIVSDTKRRLKITEDMDEETKAQLQKELDAIWEAYMQQANKAQYEFEKRMQSVERDIKEAQDKFLREQRESKTQEQGDPEN